MNAAQQRTSAREGRQHAASQHDGTGFGPRPLPLFLDMLRSETEHDPVLRAAALRGLRRYQEAPRIPRRMKPARRRKGAARLRDHGGEGPPVVFVPSLINPPFVLDLAPGRSLIEHVVDNGFHAWLVDWGEPRARDRDLDIAGHVTQRLLPLLATFEEPPILVGYCLGGTMALAAAALMQGRVRALATIAAPWRFAGYGDRTRNAMGELWRSAEPLADALGVLPMEVLQAGFWRLDPARTVAKFAAFATMDDDRAGMFVAMEDWANAGAPLTIAAGRELFGLIARDAPGRGEWRVGGTIVSPPALDCPAVEFVSITDRIVPAATAAGLPGRIDVAAGHVGMVVGGGAARALWQPLTYWLEGTNGSVTP